MKKIEHIKAAMAPLTTDRGHYVPSDAAVHASTARPALGTSSMMAAFAQRGGRGASHPSPPPPPPLLPVCTCISCSRGCGKHVQETTGTCLYATRCECKACPACHSSHSVAEHDPPKLCEGDSRLHVIHPMTPAFVASEETGGSGGGHTFHLSAAPPPPAPSRIDVFAPHNHHVQAPVATFHISTGELTVLLAVLLAAGWVSYRRTQEQRARRKRAYRPVMALAPARQWTTSIMTTCTSTADAERATHAVMTTGSAGSRPLAATGSHWQPLPSSGTSAALCRATNGRALATSAARQRAVEGPDDAGEEDEQEASVPVTAAAADACGTANGTSKPSEKGEKVAARPASNHGTKTPTTARRWHRPRGSRAVVVDDNEKALEPTAPEATSTCRDAHAPAAVSHGVSSKQGSIDGFATMTDAPLSLVRLAHIASPMHVVAGVACAACACGMDDQPPEQARSLARRARQPVERRRRAGSYGGSRDGHREQRDRADDATVACSDHDAHADEDLDDALTVACTEANSHTNR